MEDLSIKGLRHIDRGFGMEATGGGLKKLWF